MARPSVLHTGNSSSCLSIPVPNGQSLISHAWLSGDPVESGALRPNSSNKDIMWIQNLRSGANSGISTQVIPAQSLTPRLFLRRVDWVVPDSQAPPQQSWLGHWLPGWSSAELDRSLTPMLVLNRVGCVVPDSQAPPQQSWLGHWLPGWSSAELDRSLTPRLVLNRVGCVVPTARILLSRVG